MSLIEDHFKLHRAPFPQAVEPAALLHHQSLKDALDRLRFALDRDGIALVSAESGCGKSTVLGCLSRELDPTQYLVGYSSLSYLQSYPFSKIKIDKKFVDRIDTDQVSTAIIASVCVLADRISMEIVAEGVETRIQQHELRRLGIKLAQGYLYGAPAPHTAKLRPRLKIVSSN